MNGKVLLAVMFISIAAVCSAQFAGGNGTVDNPWQIETAQHLNNIRNYLGLEHNNKYFAQTADIDLGVPPWNEGSGWLPIGDFDNRFFGSYNGNHHEITNLTIRRDTPYIGLFGYIYVSNLNSIRLMNVEIDTNANNNGALAGYANGSYIGKCHIQGKVIGSHYVGGITGSLVNSTMYESSFEGLVRGVQIIGGLAGQNHFESEISRCYTNGLAMGQWLVGGITGDHRVDSVIRDSYSTMTIQGIIHSQRMFGGLVGRNRSSSIVRSYAISSISACSSANDLGGLIGEYDGGVIENSYWNSETSGLDESPGGMPLTTEQMINAESYEGWDFDRVWQMSEGSYPWLIWQEQPNNYNTPGPFNLITVANNETGTVDLNWEILDSQQRPSLFRIYRNNHQIIEVDYPQTEHRDTEAAANFNHRYYVTALFIEEDLEKETAPSNTENVLLTAFFPGGNGSAENPYQVNSAATLNLVRNDLEAHYVQTADIDLGLSPWSDDLGWVPIGFNPQRNTFLPFSGSYEGNGHIISNLTINTTYNNRGLFSRMNNATVRNLGLLDVEIIGVDYVGGIAGYIIDDSVIESCFVTGYVGGSSYVGGIAGWMGSNDRGSSIINCYSYTVLSTQTLSNFHSAGGIVGIRYQGDVIGNYAVGPVYSLVESINVNALIGANSTREGEVRDNYWNIETTLQQRGASRGEMPGSTTREMMRQETYTGFDFEEVWRIDENRSLPYLSWEGEEAGEHNLPPLLPPLNLTAEGGFNFINLSWDIPNPEMGNPDGYNIYRNENKINQEPVPENDFRDNDATPWIVHRYQVSAVYGDDESWLSNAVFASAISFAGGSGTEADPFLVENVEHLDGIRYALDRHFRQIADINLEPHGNWEPLTDELYSPFSGSFDGDGYVISGLTIAGRVGSAGLFSNLNGAIISNVSLEAINMTEIMSGGGLAASVLNSRITNSYTEGRVLSGGIGLMGGFIGSAGSGAVIIDCRADIETSGYMGVGGFVGRLYSGSMIQRCFSRGIVSARTPCSREVGGFVGFNFSGTIIDSYTRATVNAAETVMSVGGFAGYTVGGNITNCYAAGELNSGQQAGGLIGAGAGNVTNSYWDMEVSGYQNSVAGEGRHTRQMVYPHDQETYTDWDFDEVWMADDGGVVNNGYPAFHWQSGVVVPYPNIASNPQPRNWQENISVELEQLAWSYISNPQFTDPVGFRVYFNDTGEFDEDSPYVWVPYEEGEENYSTSEILPPVLGYESLFHWKVVPTTIPQNSTTITRRKNKTSLHYNSLSNRRQNAKTPKRQNPRFRGDAEGVPVWCFLTEADFTNIEEAEETPLVTLLVGNYPNPFNPATTISFSLAESNVVTLEVFNIKGHRVIKLIDNHRDAGYHKAVWNGKDENNRTVGSGVYLYRMKTKDYIATDKMILMK